VGPSVEQLGDHACGRAQQHHDGEEHQHGGELGKQAQSGGQWQRIMNVLHAGIPLAPDQHATVEGDDDDDVEEEVALDEVDDVVGDRVGHVVVHLGDDAERGEQLDHAEQHHDHEDRSGDHGAQVATNLPAELAPAG
jgi:hypothetical protein